MVALDDLPMSCVITARDGRWLAANSKFRAQFGQGVNETEPECFEALLTPASRIFFQTHVYPMLFSQGHVDTIACHVQPPGGERLAVYISGRLQAGSAGEHCIWLIFGGPERQHFESALIEARRQAEMQAVQLREANAELERLQVRLIEEMEITAATNQTLATLAVQDSLTQLGNRRALEGIGARRRRRVGEQRFAVLMIDIDHFKEINDRYGHARGDRVLCEIAAALQSLARKEDCAIRYGGEEFLLLLEDVDREGAMHVAARLHAQILNSRPGGLAITVSIGIATAKGADEDLQAIITRADSALYEAKRAGRNQTVMG